MKAFFALLVFIPSGLMGQVTQRYTRITMPSLAERDKQVEACLVSVRADDSIAHGEQVAITQMFAPNRRAPLYQGHSLLKMAGDTAGFRRSENEAHDRFIRDSVAYANPEIWHYETYGQSQDWDYETS